MVVHLPLLGQIDLAGVILIQEFLTSYYADMISLTIFFAFYAFIVWAVLLVVKMHGRSYAVSIAVSLVIFEISATISRLYIVQETQPRYLGARDVLFMYVPEQLRGLWVPTWGFPSEHLVLTAFSILLLSSIYQRKTFFLGYGLLAYLSAIYVGDHFVSDLPINAALGYCLYVLTVYLRGVRSFTQKLYGRRPRNFAASS
jgi:hypothetical protein